ncbi:mannose-6-phosphate isomerase, class I [Aeromicrobium camelliae]|uniref:mannose-6-phosphate isomerase n=1 Tax=Aeromicrobium camelliae TaxID=1538144 RepID=A0A3N6X687_9ACTN|nr:mannose-6-phosphate isomerase, class I [Aeromicrobium camelliae]RQN09635.1 mannose-6-phosphate isomerase, class I [Aeromicrobium camelliae]
MFVLENAVRHYDWGSFDEIPRFVGSGVNSEPVAEVWMGTHSMDPSLVTHQDGTTQRLDEIAGSLPFLLKLLSARRPLSLQVHPDLPTAREGYERENTLGIALDAPDRTFKDPNHKPEMVYALSTFDTVVGFRPTAEILRVLAPLEAPLAQRLHDDLRANPGFAGIVRLVEWLLSEPIDPSQIDAVIQCCRDLLDQGLDIKRAYATALMIRQDFPNDPGVVISLLLNRLTLQPGEAAFLDTGVIHAHLRGLCLEVMATSDNVLRAGLTSKHLDPRGLVACLDVGMSRLARVTPQAVGVTTEIFDPGIGDFALAVTQCSRGEPDGVPLLDAPDRIVFCTGGEVELVSARDERLKVRRGEAVYAGPDDGTLRVYGTGEVAQAYAPQDRDALRSRLVDLV